MELSTFSSVRRLLLLALFSGACLLPAKLFATTETSKWFKNSEMEFSVRKDIVSDTDYPSTYAQRGNIDCDNLSFTKRDGDTLPFLPLHKESSVTGCYISTSLGALDTNGLINVLGTPYVAETVKPGNAPTSFFAFPNSDIFISNATGTPAVGAHVWFDHLGTSLHYDRDNYGRIRAVVKPQAQTVLADKSGNNLPVMADNFAASDNGEWAVVDSPGRALLRINLNTMEVLPFAGSFEFGNGIGAAVRLAISSNGRYAAVASKNYATFKIFDLSTCSTAPVTITAPASGCQSRDLNPFARSKIGDMGGVLQIRFLTDELIQFYATYNITTTPITGKFVIAAPDTYLTGMDYLGMGDSYSSGEGAHKYEIGTDELDFNLCHLSKVSYPYLIAKKIQANNFHSVACSGAKTVNIRGGTGPSQDKKDGDRDNQYNSNALTLNNSLGDWLPGYKKQIGFISINNPRIVTLGVGGNDIGFADKLISCLKPGTCFPSYEDRQEVFNEIDSKLTTLASTFKKTKEYATKNARIYIVGYPQVAKPDGNCALNVHLNNEELIFTASVISRLNAVIHVAADQAGVNYVHVEDAFKGYRMCENKYSSVAVNGITAGNDKFGIIGNESYHPNEFGHSLLANTILGLTEDLGTSTPPPQPTVKLPKIKDDDPALKNAPKTGRALKKKVTTQPKAKAVKKGGKVTMPLKGTKNALPPKTTYTTSVNGTPVGTVTTDDNGDVDAEVPIPTDTPTGPADINITGPDVTGEQVDIGAVVTVGNEGDDFDGDALPDATDSCPLITNAGVDADQDGIDDVCDPVISEPPTLTLPPTPATNTQPSSTTPSSGDTELNTPTAPVSPVVISLATTATVVRQTYTSQRPTTVIDITNDATEVEVGDNSGTATANPQAANAPTKLTVTTNNQSIQTEATGQVLGAQTSRPSDITSARRFASATKSSLNLAASAHPLRMLGVLSSLVFALSVLGLQQRRDRTRQKVFITPAHHNLHV